MITRTCWHRRLPLLAAACALALSHPVHAADGRIEISQTVAEEGGVNGDLVADPAGFPIVLGQPGSYVLTSNLVPPDADTTAILVDAEPVRIDFNGFGIDGPGGTGSGNGVNHTVGAARLVLRNGFIRKVGGDGVRMIFGRMLDMVVSQSGGDGIVLGQGSVEGCEVSVSGGSGIRADAPGRVHVERTNLFSNASGSFEVGLLAGDRITFGPGVDCLDDARCNRQGMRVYYLTSSAFVSGDAATTACDDGFHMASRAELTNPSNLFYDVNRGVTADDSGGGPTNTLGWVRTGVAADTSNSPGGANCNAWASGSNAHFGSAMAFDPAATLAAERSHPWRVSTLTCDFPAPVWCIQN